MLHSHMDNRDPIASSENEKGHQHPDMSPSVMMLHKSHQGQQATLDVREKEEEREQEYLKLDKF